MVDRPPTEKELAEILAKYRRAGGGQIMTGGALSKLAAEFDLEKKDTDSEAEKAPASDKKTVKSFCRSDSRGLSARDLHFLPAAYFLLACSAYAKSEVKNWSREQIVVDLCRPRESARQRFNA